MTNDDDLIIESKELLAGRYEMRHRLGSGGMAHVFLAWDHALEREVAVKLLHRDLVDIPDAVARFRSEAKMLARVDSNQVVQIHDLHVGPSQCYLVLQRLIGKTLDHVVEHGGSLRTVRALQITCDVLLGVSTLHRDSVVHRDIKPANVLIGADGRATLLDLGVAIDPRVGPLEPPGETAGTPRYMSPEQKMTGHVDTRSDIYQVGMLLLFALTGHKPTIGRLALLEQLEDLAPAVAMIITRATEEDPEARFQSASEMYETALIAAQETDTLPINLVRKVRTSRGTPPPPVPVVREHVHMVEPAPERPERSAEPAASSASGRWMGMAAIAAVGTAVVVALGAVGPAPKLLPLSASMPLASVDPADIEMETEPMPPPSPTLTVTPILADVHSEVHIRATHARTPEQARRASPVRGRSRGDEIAPSRELHDAVPQTADDFLRAARTNEHNGMTESAIASYRQYVIRTPDREASQPVRAHLAELEAHR